MFSGLPLHVALILVPFLNPADLARARRVCKPWHAVFSSPTLLQMTLRIHFPLSREARFRPESSNYSGFNRVAKRYAALKSGVPQQELRFPIAYGLTNPGACPAWTFSENLLVFEYPPGNPSLLDLTYLDPRSESKRIRNGRLRLPPSCGTRRVIGLKVCRDMLIVERAVPALGTTWEYFVDCFRLSLPAGSSEVVATDLYCFCFEGYDRTITSDHSGKYYAAYLRAPVHPKPGTEVIQVWDIETGNMIQRINGPFFHASSEVRFTDIMVVAKQGFHGPQQVVISGSDNSYTRSKGWATLTELKVFPIGDGQPGWDGYVKSVQSRRPTVFKVPRSPTGIDTLDDPASPTYEGEKIGLAFWGVDSSSGVVTSSYRYLIPDELAGESRVPLTADRECRIHYKTGGARVRPPFVVQRRSGLSFSLSYLTNGEAGDPSAPLSLVTLRSFYPSTTPGLMELEWETQIKGPHDEKNIWRYYGDFVFRPPPSKDICGDEFATAFLQSQEGQLYVSLVVWDEPFLGEAKGGFIVE